MGAMLQMMERMLGKDGQGQGKEPGQKNGDQAGQGGTGDTNQENENITGDPNDATQKRTVPKTAGSTGQNLPAEFQKALEAYNQK